MDKLRPILKQVRLLVGFLKFRILLIVGVALVMGANASVTIYLNKLLIDNLANIITGKTAFNDVVKVILIIVAIQFCLSFGINIVQALMRYLKEIYSKKISLRITEDLYAKLQRIKYENFEDPSVLDMLYLAQSQMSFTPIRMLDNFINILQALIGLTGMIIILITQSWVALIPAVLMAIPSFLFENYYSKKVYQVEKGRAPFRRKDGYLRSILGNRETAAEISFYAYREKLTNRMMALGRMFLRQDKKILKKRIVLGKVIEFFASLTYWAYYVFIIFNIAAKRFTIGDFSLYTGAFLNIQNQVKQILFNVTQIYNHALFVQNYYRFLDLPEIQNNALLDKLTFCDTIEFRNVSFTYPKTDKVVLQNVNLTLKRNERIALVGENGSGKTTFTKLLLGFYEGYSGEILIDGVELRDYNVAELRKMFGVVFQEFQKYFFTARENIEIGRTDDRGFEATRDAARQSGAAQFIEGLPKKYDALLGRFFKDGTELSRGQWQKIAIARCFIRDAQVFIMDEPSASLDPKSEHQIYEHFHDFSKDKTAILISHRLSNVNQLDKIYVFDNGRIIEQGDHASLMANNGAYYQLYERQRRGYESRSLAAVS